MAGSLIVKKSDGIASVLLNRPEAFNALNMEMAESLAANAITLAADEACAESSSRGRGKRFVQVVTSNMLLRSLMVPLPHFMSWPPDFIRPFWRFAVCLSLS